jgi:hypothetical protein
VFDYPALYRAIEERRAFLDTFNGREVVTGYNASEGWAYVGSGVTRHSYCVCPGQIKIAATPAEALTCPTLVPSPWSRAAIDALKPGDRLQHTVDCTFSRAHLDARWSEPREVVAITFRGVNTKGQAYVGGRLDYGHGSTITFSFSEGDGRYRPARES